jgi:PAS domain S-box-containing protein
MVTRRPRRMHEQQQPQQRGDLEARNVLRASDERFRVAFNASAIGFAIVELDGRIREVNRSLCEMLGYSQAELLAATFTGLTYPDDVTRNAAIRESLLTGELESFQLEERYIHRTGKIVWALLTVSIVRKANGRPACYVSQIIDVTARKDAEQAAARHAAELERSNVELEHFAYVASHDLREPLRTVGSYSRLLADTYGDAFDDRAQRWIRYLGEGVERMQRLIDGLLALARVRTDGAKFKTTDTATVVKRVWRGLRMHHPQIDAYLQVGPLPTLSADAGQIEQLFQNLFDNAMKYRRVETPLNIHVSAVRVSRERDAIWEFTVRDNGIGVEMKHADRIFRIFERIQRDDEGAGIGLAICKRIVERHRGRIAVESSPGEGTSIVFTLAE